MTELENDYFEDDDCEDIDYSDDIPKLFDYIRQIEKAIEEIIGESFDYRIWEKANNNYTAYDVIKEIADLHNVKTAILTKKICEILAEEESLSESEVKEILSRLDGLFDLIRTV
jgi:hypothetical protein